MGVRPLLPVGRAACAWTAAGGHLETLKWALEHDCPWNEASVRAEAFGHVEVLRWLDEHGDCGGRT